MKKNRKSKKTIILREQEVMIRIGAHPHEQTMPQPVLISVEIGMKNKNENDCLEKTFDYCKLHDFIQGLESEPHCALQETIARRILHFALSIKDASRAKVEISKPKAFKNSKFAGICLEAFK